MPKKVESNQSADQELTFEYSQQGFTITPIDEAVIVKAMDGDKRSFEAIFMGTYRYVFAAVRQYLKNDADAYDAIQDTYTRVYKNLSKLENASSFYPWLHRIAENCAKDVLKFSKGFFHDSEVDLADSDNTEKTDYSVDVTEVLKQLPKEQMELLVRVYYDKMHVTEIAKMQGVPVTTVYNRLGATKRKLKQLLKVRGIDKPIYGGAIFSMVSIAIRNAIGTELLSMAIAEEILHNVVNSTNKKGAAVISHFARKARSKAALKIATSLLLACSLLTVLVLIVAGQVFGIFSSKGTPSDPSGVLGTNASQTSSTDTSHATSSQSPTSSDTSAGGDFAGGSSNRIESTQSTPSTNNSSNVSSFVSSAENSNPDSSDGDDNSEQEGSSIILTSNQIKYTISDGKATLTDVDESIHGDVIIPANIDGHPVVAIGGDAFVNCSYITSVVIPEGVEKIGSWAFWLCDSLESVTIPKSVTVIEGNMLQDCGPLERIILNPENPNYYMVDGCLIERETMTLKASERGCVTIPEGVKIIGNSAFFAQSGRITIPDSVVVIGQCAFAESNGNIIIENLPRNLERIYAYALYGCVFAEDLTIPDTVVEIVSGAFYKTTIKNVTWKCGIHKIDNYTFQDSTIETIRIPKWVTEIGESAFEGCSSLTDVYYEGTEADRDAMLIGTNNEELLNATWHYNSY